MICQIMEWDLPLEMSSSYIEKSESDLRSLFAKKAPLLDLPPYTQVFHDKENHVSNLSILDLIFNLGPEAGMYLTRLDISDIVT